MHDFTMRTPTLIQFPSQAFAASVRATAATWGWRSAWGGTATSTGQIWPTGTTVSRVTRTGTITYHVYELFNEVYMDGESFFTDETVCAFYERRTIQLIGPYLFSVAPAWPPRLAPASCTTRPGTPSPPGCPTALAWPMTSGSSSSVRPRQCQRDMRTAHSTSGKYTLFFIINLLEYLWGLVCWGIFTDAIWSCRI